MPLGLRDSACSRLVARRRRAAAAEAPRGRPGSRGDHEEPRQVERVRRSAEEHRRCRSGFGIRRARDLLRDDGARQQLKRLEDDLARAETTKNLGKLKEFVEALKSIVDAARASGFGVLETCCATTARGSS